MAREKDDLDQYKRDQDIFFKEIEELKKEAKVKEMLHDLQKRGGKFEELRKLYASLYGNSGFLVGRRPVLHVKMGGHARPTTVRRDSGDTGSLVCRTSGTEAN
jgi:hypothetical protein